MKFTSRTLRALFALPAAGTLASLGMVVASPAGAGLVALPPATHFAYVGTSATYTVPADVCGLSLDVAGAQGGLGIVLDGGVGGHGGTGSGTLLVTPGRF